MQDHLGLPVEVGDYIFGGGASKLYEIVDRDETSELRAIVIGLGERTTRKVHLCDFIKVSKEQIVIYFMQKGYKL